MRIGLIAGVVVSVAAAVAPAARAEVIVNFGDPSGLAGIVTFHRSGGGLILKVRATNTSTGVPIGFDSADQILTTVSFDLGADGAHGYDPKIVGGSVVIGDSSQSVNFDNVASQLGPGADVSAEFGYGNKGWKINLEPDMVTSMESQSTQFAPSAANLDGTGSGLNGPQGGLVSNPIVVPIGGLGGIRNQWLATLHLDKMIPNLDFISNGVRIEYGSDAFFLSGTPFTPQVVPEPSSFAIYAIGGVLLAAGVAIRRRRRAA